MKKIMVALLIALGMLMTAQADVVEIKDGSGRYYQNTGYQQPYRAARLHVCYDRRVRVFSRGYYYLRYDGCVRSRYSCGSIGKAHFGRYPSVRAARRALHRCRTARPRFVD